jgi:hypothetical protein
LDQLYSSKADDRAAAQGNLKEARDIYAKLVRDCRDDPILMQECLMGEAKAKESLGDLDGALTAYLTLLNDYKDGYLAQEAEEHKEQLQDPDKRSKVEKFYQELNGLAEGNAPTPK